MKGFKTTRQMRGGASLIRDRFIHARKPHKCNLDWGRTTPASIGRWLRVQETRLRERERLHPPERSHLRADLLRWLDDVGAEGKDRLLREWPHLRGPSDAERAAKGAARQNARLAKKHPLFAAMGALDEVATVATPESTLAHWRGLWANNRELRTENAKDGTTSAQGVRERLHAVEEGENDTMTIKQMSVWGRCALFRGERVYTLDGRPTVDRPHYVLTREVLLAWSRDEEHLRRMIGGIFYANAARGFSSDLITHALGALRLIALELLGDEAWLDEWTQRGQRRRLELESEAEAARRARQGAFKPRAEQMLIPLEVT